MCVRVVARGAAYEPKARVWVGCVAGGLGGGVFVWCAVRWVGGLGARSSVVVGELMPPVPEGAGVRGKTGL